MTILEFTGTPARLGALRDRAVALAGRFASLAPALAQHIRLREAERTLQSMPDHMLKDIGISRADIRHRVRGLD